MNRPTSYAKVDSPVGPLTLVADGDDLIGVYFENAALAANARSPRRRRAGCATSAACARPPSSSPSTSPASGRASTCRSRRAGRRSSAPSGTALLAIPYGETTSYGELARAIGRPTASRAVGAANGRNPLSIVIPCHRVIGADGSMTGYGGEISRKRVLLDLEARVRGARPGQRATRSDRQLDLRIAATT